MFRRCFVALLLLIQTVRAVDMGAIGAEFFGGGTKAEMLTLEQAIGLALKNNLDASFERVGISVEEARRRLAVGAFDPTISINALRESIRRPENSNDFTSTDALRQTSQIEAINANTNAAIAQANAINAQTVAQRNNANAQLNAINAETNAINTQNNLKNPLALPSSLAPTDLSTSAVTDAANSVIPTTAPVFNPVGVNEVIFDQQNDRLNSSLQGRTPWGARYGVQVEANRLRNTFTGDLRTVFPEYQTTVSATIIQPLLRNFGADANLADVRVARLVKKAQIITWELRIATTVQSVISTYYDMLYAMRDIEVRQDAITAGEKLVAQNQRRFSLGFMSPIDVRQAEVSLSTDREALLISKGFFMENQFKLKRLILNQYQANDRRVFVPMTAPRLQPPKLDRAELMATAFARRYDYQASLIEAQVQDVRVRFARNQLWPEVDLVGTYGLNGLRDNYGDSFGEAFGGHAAEWTAGVQIQIPWGFVKERAQLNLVKGLKEQAVLKIKQTELTVGVDVDTVISRVLTNRQRLDTARQTRELSDEAVRIALKRLEEGQSSSFDVIEQQRKLYEAKSRELATIADFNKSVSQLWLVTGVILDRQGIFFDKAKN